MSDERALIERAGRGDRDALQALAVTHRPLVLRTATHLLGDGDAAEDATQEVFLRLQASLSTFRGDAELGTWLYRVTLNVCRDELRRRRWRASRTADAPEETSSGESPERAIDAARARAAVRAAVARLPDAQREAVTLRYIDDLSYDDIARKTGTPRGTVASRVFRALKRLGQDLEPRHLEVMK